MLNEEGDTESRYKSNSGTPYVKILIGICIKLNIQDFEDNSIPKEIWISISKDGCKLQI